MSARLGARFAPRAPVLDRLPGPWPRLLPPWVWSWIAWVDHGRPVGKRPPSAPARIPAWAWARYALHVRRPAPVPPPPAPPHGHLQRFERAIFAAEDPLAAASTPPTYPIFLTADPAYEQYASQSVLDTLRGQGRQVGAWCNPTQVPQTHLRQFAAARGIPADLLVGQCETSPEFDASDGLPAVVGSANVLTAAQRARVLDGTVALLVEDYFNVMPWLVQDWAGLPVVCSIAGLYKGEGVYGRYVPLADYIGTGRFSVGRDGIYHAAGPREADHSGDYAPL